MCCGVILFILTVCHLYLGRAFFKGLGKGPLPPSRLWMAIVDIALLILLCVQAVTSSILTGLVPGSLESSARPLHLCIGWWAFLLAGLHIGLHVPFVPFKDIKQDTDKGIKIRKLIAILIDICGIAFFIRENVFLYLVRQLEFVSFDVTNPLVRFLGGVAMLHLFSDVSGFHVWRLRQAEKAAREEKKEKEKGSL